jgi:hypothetical protein
MPTKFKVFDVRKVPSAEPERIGKFDQLIMYELDPMRRYIVRIPAEEFSEDRMKQEIKKDMAEREAFTGKEYEIE